MSARDRETTYIGTTKVFIYQRWFMPVQGGVIQSYYDAYTVPEWSPRHCAVRDPDRDTALETLRSLVEQVDPFLVFNRTLNGRVGV